jgi:hypothetical protein
MAVAYPFVNVDLDLKGLAVVTQRAPGVVALVGQSATGTAAVGAPDVVTDAAEADAKFGPATRLGRSLKLTLGQEPKPSKVYGVKATGSPPAAADYQTALRALEGVDDVTFVALADEPVDLAAPNPAAAVAILNELKTHVENTSDAGNKRVGVAWADPGTRGTTDVQTIATQAGPLKGNKARLIMIATRGAVLEGTATRADVAAAAMGAIAGHRPHISIVLKPVNGITLPPGLQWGASEVVALANADVNPIIDPVLIAGTSIYFAEGRMFTGLTALQYVDARRVVDDIEARLKFGLVGSIGDARITKAGLTAVKVATEGILEPLQREAVIDDFAVRIPVLDVLFIPETARSPGDVNLVTTARGSRTVPMEVRITYGPAVHLLNVTLAVKF